MPVKNAGPFLTDCLNSILSQTESNWELIAVDDHSDDNSFELLEKYSKNDPRIQLEKSTEHGIIPALQIAYSNSKGTFIHRMDADDIMHSNKLGALKSLLIRKGKGHLATARVKYFASHGVSDGYLKYEKWLNTLCNNDSHWNDIYKECVIPSPCWLVHREDFNRCGAFDSELYPEDYDLAFRFYQHQLTVVSNKTQLHLWRDHVNRTSRNDERYKQNTFFKIKLHYFLALDYNSQRPLVLWGAGPKGKIMAKLLQEENIPFDWVSNNPNKHGKDIYNQIMESFEKILIKDRPQVIVTVAQKDTQDEIVSFFEKNQLSANQDYWFFR